LSKARSDGALLVSALRDQDEEAVRGALFNFAVTTYHVWDWVKTYRADLDADATNPLRKHEALKACRDLGNASKHASLDLAGGPYRKHPPVVQDVTVSATARTTFDEAKRLVEVVTAGPAQVASGGWRLKVQLQSGRRLAVEDLVREALDAWEQYFAQHSIV
jgi:hypothetical protein